jgi:histidine ammonia-lyase
MEPLYIDGYNLTLKDVVSVARYGRKVYLHEKSKELTTRCRTIVDILVQHNVPVYGLTTGFGSKRNVFIDKEDTKILQHNLIRSHASGIGTPLSEDVVRAALLLRANALSRGHSGLRAVVLEKILELLNKNVYPWVPDQGSVSASGDLAPLSHLSLVIVGDNGGKIYDPRLKRENKRGANYVEKPVDEGFVYSTPENLKSFFDYEPISLEAKEGLALTNGVQVTCGLGIMNSYDAASLAAQGDISCSLSMEALKGIITAFDKDIANARPYPGQISSAYNVRTLLKDSSILSVPLNLAILDKSIRLLKDSKPLLIEEKWKGKLTEIIEGLSEIQKNPHDFSKKNMEKELETEVIEGVYVASDPLTLSLRKGLHPWQLKVFSLIRRVLESEIDDPRVANLRENLTTVAELLEKAVPKIPSVQNDYSFRCASQVHGAVRNVLNHVMEILLIEANSSTDNPLIFPPDGPEDLEEYKKSLTVEKCKKAVRSGGNFHGEPLAFAMDYLSMAIAELGSISERRVAKIVDMNHNNGLPSLLVYQSGLNSGFMIPQYTAAALVSENKTLCFPASVDSIPTCENTEDHVSMGLIAARKTRSIIENAEKIIAIEFLTAFQGIHFRKPFNKELGIGTQAVFDLMENTQDIEFVKKDRILAPMISKTLELVCSRTILEKVISMDLLSKIPHF